MRDVISVAIEDKQIAALLHLRDTSRDMIRGFMREFSRASIKFDHYNSNISNFGNTLTEQKIAA